MEPHFQVAMRDAMAPVGLSIAWWREEAGGSERIEIPVVVVNDTDAAWGGEVRVSLARGARTLETRARPARVDPAGRGELVFTLTMPPDPGEVDVIASLRGPDGAAVRSIRTVKIGGGASTPPPPATLPVATTPEQQKAKTIQDATGVGKKP